MIKLKSKILEVCLTVTLLCRENNVSPMNYMRYMEWIIARHNPNVVLGDLNEVFSKESVLLRFLTLLSFI